MQMKSGVEQSLYALLLLHMLPERAVLRAEPMSKQLRTSPTYFQKLLRKLANADLVTSIPGVKGGFKLKRKSEDICIHDIYLAIEGHQPLYEPTGILDDLFDLKTDEYDCLLINVMDEAENSWINILKRESIATIYNDVASRFEPQVITLQKWVADNMIVK